MMLYVKNMVCNRCIAAVKQVLDAVPMPYTSVQLGEVTLLREPTKTEREQVSSGLEALGFELLDDSRKQLIEKIKAFIIQLVQTGGEQRYPLSYVLSTALNKEYSYLSHLFSDVEGLTIEKYLIHQKIEKVKELLAYNQTSLNEIAFNLGYSSVAHLSAQFKKVTGLTPTQFKRGAGAPRRPLDAVTPQKDVSN